MYKITTSLDNNSHKKDNKKDNKQITNGYKSDLIHQDIQKMHILPPHCPLYPNGYKDFFNNEKTLKPMSPYKLESVKHPKDGKIYKKLEYNNFYSDWKQDALKWYPKSNIEYENIETTPNNINMDSGNMDSGNMDSGNMDSGNMELYEKTKKHKQFAIPLATNGTNQLNIVFNYKCTEPTFDYKRYASRGINNKEWFNNPLYTGNISNETEELKDKYMNNIMQNSMDLYSSVFEDMYLLGYEPKEEES